MPILCLAVSRSWIDEILNAFQRHSFVQNLSWQSVSCGCCVSLTSVIAMHLQGAFTDSGLCKRYIAGLGTAERGEPQPG